MVVINWTEQAKNDLVSIAEFIALDSKRFALITVQNLRQSVQQLKKFPNSGRIVPELNNAKLRELVYGNYRIIYLLRESDTIDILTIHHTSRNLRFNDLLK